MRRTTIIIVSALVACVALAYLPPNWTPEHADTDFSEADAIVVARVIGLNRSTVTNLPTWVDFHATFIVARSIKGDLNSTNQFSFLIGTDSLYNISDEAQPSYGFILHGSQLSYHFQINGVYLLFLSKTKEGWEPRSGPYSVFRIQKKNTKERARLVVIPKNNKVEATDDVKRQIEEPSRVLLDEFLKKKQMEPNKTPEHISEGRARPSENAQR
jgi:hypothetical protein